MIHATTFGKKLKSERHPADAYDVALTSEFPPPQALSESCSSPQHVVAREVLSSATPPTKSQVHSMLLTVSEMPTGWATAPNDKSSSSSTNDLCSKQTETLSRPLTAQCQPPQPSSRPARPSCLRSLLNFVAYVPNTDNAYSAINDCLNSTTTVGTGSDKGTIGQMSFPTLGDRSGAWSISFQASFISISAPVVIAQKGTYLVFMLGTSGGTSGSGDTQFQQLATKAVEKVG